MASLPEHKGNQEYEVASRRWEDTPPDTVENAEVAPRKSEDTLSGDLENVDFAPSRSEDTLPAAIQPEDKESTPREDSTSISEETLRDTVQEEGRAYKKDMAAFFILGVIVGIPLPNILLPLMHILGCLTYHGNKRSSEFHVCRHYRSLGHFHGRRSGSYYVCSTAGYTPCLLQRTPPDLLCGQRPVLCSLRRWPKCRWPGNRNYLGWLCVCVRYQLIPFRRRLLRSTHRNRVQYRLWSDTLLLCPSSTMLIFLGFSSMFGPSLYIAFMQAFDSNWRHSILLFLPFAFLQHPVWWFLLSARNRNAAEETRRTARKREAERLEIHQAAKSHIAMDGIAIAETATTSISDSEEGTGFGPGRTRIGLFWKTIFPQYVIPLLMCTCGAMFIISGLAPTFGTLNTFKGAPSSDALGFEIDYLLYGVGQFLGSGVAMFWKFPLIWLFALTQLILMVVAIIQLFAPFLTYYGVWLVVMFAVGTVVGGGVTNTNYKVADDFHGKGETEDVRSFAMSYGGLGNFGGDALGGGLAIIAQKLAVAHLKVRSHGGL